MLLSHRLFLIISTKPDFREKPIINYPSYQKRDKSKKDRPKNVSFTLYSIQSHINNYFSKYIY